MDIQIKNLLRGSEGLTRPFTKLVECVFAYLGAQAEPGNTVRHAKAEAESRILSAEADIEIGRLRERAMARVRATELSRQRNIDSIVEKALHILPESVSETPVDPDWLSRFFAHAQDVGHEDMQALWAKLLAGEVAAPGSFSLRTLNAVGLFRRQEAELFTRFCTFVWDSRTKLPFAFCGDGRVEAYVRSRISWLELVVLQSANLVVAVPEGYHFEVESEESIGYFDQSVSTSGARGLKVQLGRYKLTDIGEELAPLAGAQGDPVYLSLCLADLARQGISRP